MKGRDIRIHDLQYPESAVLLVSPAQRRQWCRLHERNKFTIKSALLRGDTSVTLLNCKRLPSRVWDFFDLADQEIDQLQIDAYPLVPMPVRDPDPNGDLKADARKDIESRSWYGMKFKFVKVLAKGGQGYVSLWDIGFDDGSTKRVVIKKALGPDFDPKKEVEFHLRYNHAEHTTQVVNLRQESLGIHEAMLKKDPSCRPRFRKGHVWDPERMGCAVFEYAPYGDVWKYMEAFFPGKKEFPNQVLWGIMECYTLGIATVSYTPTFEEGSTFEQEYKRAEELDKVEDLLDHAETAWYSTHDVHLDLEALNVLIGEDPSHEYQPVFKLHDLGAFSECMRAQWRTTTEAKIWGLRHFPKSHAVTPEQISKEWDNLPIRLPPKDARRQFCGEIFEKGTKCAGRFGTWTNVFLIARVMESMITREIMRYPFRPAPHKKADGSEGPQTYGWRLQEQRHAWVDPELRDLICMCLYENPGDRPSPLNMLRAIKKWKDSGHHDPTELVEWWKDVRGPRPVEHHRPKAPNANSNAIRQGVIDQMGVLALHSVGQPHSKNQPSAVIQPTQPAIVGAAPNQSQRQGPVQGNQGGANPQQVPPAQPQQPNRPADPHVPAKVATTRNKKKRPANIQVRLEKRPSAGIGSGEAMDIEREEAAYQFSGDPDNFAAPIVPPAQIQNIAQPGRPSSKSIVSIKRVTQHPARRIGFEDPLKPSKGYKIHKNLLSPKIGKVVRRPGPKKSQALEALVRGVTSRMPVTIQNLMSRAKEIEARLDIGAVPIYAYLK
ncbi:hypothetical protein FVEN_g6244 [Fusarium venenatum]|uniref:Protein kinase domain-containing protein n=1 Tax=Fusarium venenatum TaxID=56646 RepID=A0A2L2TV10_9HYPO|nr:uncharacterized protein FVRRES_01842 [Fusarium venenatum]KAG8355896.1 hypothetical protein FVEN_g6244 [Fusarium venenatum]KAH7005009.1 hypothetical protein EDB82DRAFT_65774 [Fusarium venenatum]CEI65330.1 unnamed protein product [Fusarium venenatum]